MFKSHFLSKGLFIISSPVLVVCCSYPAQCWWYAVVTHVLILISQTFDVKVSLKDISTVLIVATLKTFNTTSKAILDHMVGHPRCVFINYIGLINCRTQLICGT